MGNPEPSFNLKVEEGVETIPSGSTLRHWSEWKRLGPKFLFKKEIWI